MVHTFAVGSLFNDVNKVLIVTVDLVGVSDPDGTLRGISQTQEQSGGLFSFLQDSSGALFSGGGHCLFVHCPN